MRAAPTVARIARPGDLVITVGCGDVTKVAPKIVAELERQRISRAELPNDDDRQLPQHRVATSRWIWWPDSPGRASVPREPQARRFRGKALLAWVLVLAAMAGAGWLVGFSPVLAVERVEIGCHRLAASALRRRLRCHWVCPWPRQDLAAIAGRVSALPQIESAQVSRRWPHTIRVAVVERRPMLGVRQPEGFILIDTRGVASNPGQPCRPGCSRPMPDPTDVEVLVEVGAIAAAMPRYDTEPGRADGPHPGRR